MITLPVWKKIFPGAHIEQMRSTFVKNEKYCSKEGQLIEHDTLPKQGQRSDINTLKVHLDAGKRPLPVPDEEDGMFSVVARHHRFAETYYQYKRQKTKGHDHTAPEVYVRIGPPGTGKTKRMDDTWNWQLGYIPRQQWTLVRWLRPRCYPV